MRTARELAVRAQRIPERPELKGPAD